MMIFLPDDTWTHFREEFVKNEYNQHNYVNVYH